MSTDAQTQSIPRVRAEVSSARASEVTAAGPDGDVAATGPVAELPIAVSDAEGGAAEADDAITREQSVQEVYEQGLAKLVALHDRWSAAMAEMRGTQVTGDPDQAAA